MIKQYIKITLLFLSSIAAVEASPFVVSDPYSITSTIQPTHCGMVLDNGVKIEIPVTSDTTGKYCKLDLNSVTTGQHTLTATFIIKDVIWGNLESSPSPPFTFVRPGVPNTPTIPGLVK